jgi:predicted nucleic acid-binding protein
VLVDASGLIALLDRSDAGHLRCVEALEQVSFPRAAANTGPALLTVWPALTEAMHLLAEVPKGPATLLDMVRDDVLGLVDLDGNDVPRLAELMEKYADLPMDFADAALVCAAERSGVTHILTLDRHFTVYRLPKRARFTVLP